MKTPASVKIDLVEFSQGNLLLNRPFLLKARNKYFISSSVQFRSDYMHVEAKSAHSVNLEVVPPILNDRPGIPSSCNGNNMRIHSQELKCLKMGS